MCVYMVLYSVFLCGGNSIFQHVIMYYMYSLVYTGIVFSSRVESMINVIGPSWVDAFTRLLVTQLSGVCCCVLKGGERKGTSVSKCTSYSPHFYMGRGGNTVTRSSKAAP